MPLNNQAQSSFLRLAVVPLPRLLGIVTPFPCLPGRSAVARRRRACRKQCRLSGVQGRRGGRDPATDRPCSVVTRRNGCSDGPSRRRGGRGRPTGRISPRVIFTSAIPARYRLGSESVCRLKRDPLIMGLVPNSSFGSTMFQTDHSGGHVAPSFLLELLTSAGVQGLPLLRVDFAIESSLR